MHPCKPYRGKLFTRFNADGAGKITLSTSCRSHNDDISAVQDEMARGHVQNDRSIEHSPLGIIDFGDMGGGLFETCLFEQTLTCIVMPSCFLAIHHECYELSLIHISEPTRLRRIS